MNVAKEQGIKLAADVATGATIADVNDSSTVLVTVITIVSRVLIEFLLYLRQRKKEK